MFDFSAVVRPHGSLAGLSTSDLSKEAIYAD
jgi:hypothetical protein